MKKKIEKHVGTRVNTIGKRWGSRSSVKNTTLNLNLFLRYGFHESTSGYNEKCGDLNDCISTPKAADFDAKLSKEKINNLPLPSQVDFIIDGPRCQVARFLYANSGGGVLALGYNGIQRLWNWGNWVHSTRAAKMTLMSLVPMFGNAVIR
ncbi:hypothetical protein C5167_024242 [Papaver somniferum]|uniref:Uncharacterized protein n=1 Tax=Papaver somniferum TaxID=3469 RepID=A0A4Y7JR83_PAPSO|nr:hypothetical protein C5167_024242 [Papaver somniferum]